MGVSMIAHNPRIGVFLLCMMLAACNAPRGAGFQSEVLAASRVADSEGPAEYDFTVHTITRDWLPVLQSWPSTDRSRLGWIKRQRRAPTQIIAPGDVLNISIWDTAENSLLVGAGQRMAQLENIKVSPGGNIFLPFVGDMRVSGLSPEAVRTRIESRLINTTPSAQVQLSMIAGRANTADLVAGVKSPGPYPLPNRNFTVLGLLSQGGGVDPDLTNPQLRLMRGDRIYGASLDRVYGNPTLDTTLQGGDRVIVVSDDRYFLSLGATGTEARHLFPQDHVTALDALATIGGVAEARANAQGILILRHYPRSALRGDLSGPSKERVVFTLDLTTADGLFSAGLFHIMPGDLVYGTESPVTTAGTVLALLGAVLGVTN